MAGSFKRVFGKRGEVPSGDDSGGWIRTHKASPADTSGERVEPVLESNWIRPADRESAEGDTGPWFVGKTVGEIFEIRGVLGRGGMGIVYQADDTATQRVVAVKVPLDEFRNGKLVRRFVDDEDARKRFSWEAEAWTELIHPHIVHAFDIRDDQTTDYRPAVFMDYCDGGSLADRLLQGPPLSIPDALDIAIQICWGMEFAHEKNHIHRDLKPGNVLLTSEGKALVSDFGLVKSLELDELESVNGGLTEQDAGLRESLTHSVVVGTPEYMPPEQWVGKPCPQSDIYAFGIMLYELFCGARPFSAERGKRWQLRKVHDSVPPPDPRRHNGRLPVVLGELMLACLGKQPSERPQSFAAVADRLTASYCQITDIPHASRLVRPSAGTISHEESQAQAWSLTRLGIGCLRRGELPDSLQHFQDAEKVFEILKDPAGVATSLGHQAVILRTWGKTDKAIELLQQQERVYRQLGIQDGLATSYGSQALVFYAAGRLDEAMLLFKKQEAICETLGIQESLATSLGHQALILYAKRELVEAMRLHKREETICRRLRDQHGLQVSLSNQAIVLKDLGKLDEAMGLLQEQETICRRFGFQDGLAASLGRQAMLIYVKNRLGKASNP
ncbi:MAG: protein kinase domain-containing protein [Planctomycetota bacterium]